MYVCIFEAVTDYQISRAVAGGVTTIDDVRSCLSVSSGCWKCLDAAAAILRKQLDGQVDRQTVAGSGWGDIQSKLVLYGAA